MGEWIIDIRIASYNPPVIPVSFKILWNFNTLLIINTYRKVEVQIHNESLS